MKYSKSKYKLKRFKNYSKLNIFTYKIRNE